MRRYCRASTPPCANAGSRKKQAVAVCHRAVLFLPIGRTHACPFRARHTTVLEPGDDLSLYVQRCGWTYALEINGTLRHHRNGCATVCAPRRVRCDQGIAPCGTDPISADHRFEARAYSTAIFAPSPPSRNAVLGWAIQISVTQGEKRRRPLAALLTGGNHGTIRGPFWPLVELAQTCRPRTSLAP